MKSKVFLMVFLFILLNSAFALDMAHIKDSVEKASADVSDFFSSVSKDEVVIVTGSKISIEDKILFNMLKSQVNEVQGIKIESDEFVYNRPELDKKNLILIGGEKTNLVSNKLSALINSGEKNTISPLILVFSDKERKILILYSEKEVYNNENQAAERSPLSNIMDKKYVPVAATFLSILLLYLWNIFGKTIIGFLSEFSSSKIIQKITEKKKIKKKEAHHLKLHEFIDKAEVIALFLTSVIFATTMSWTWMKNIGEFRRMFIINFIIVALISIAREIYRQYSCYKIKVRTEYVFWPFGSIITFVSTFLGNTFSLASYTLLDDNADEERFGKISFKISLMTFILAVIAYVINIFSPSLVLQMIFVYSIIVVFIELFPMPPMPGNDIKKWSKLTWALFYLLVTASYIYMNFTIYI
jgi:hypothetical protein